MTKEFEEFPKIARFSREIIVSEKIDGTNSSVYIGEDGEFLTGSRTRWITPEADNHGFAKWAQEHKDELLTLGPGHHFGEWWGLGIQRNYGLKEKRFSLFNVIRWCLATETPAVIPTLDPRVTKMQERLPHCVGLVPVLWRGRFDDLNLALIMDGLKARGSQAAPGFMNPEGVVLYHTTGHVMFKKTFEKDDKGKGQA